MKQKRDGKKVINWHRPFAHGVQFRNRYLRKRCQDVVYEHINQLRNANIARLMDESWELFSLCYDMHDEEDSFLEFRVDEYDDTDDYTTEKLDRDDSSVMLKNWVMSTRINDVLHKIFYRHPVYHDICMATPLTKQPLDDGNSNATIVLEQHQQGLEERLATHFAKMKNTFSEMDEILHKPYDFFCEQTLYKPYDPFYSELIQSIGNLQNADIIKRIVDANPILAKRIYLLAPFWARSPYTLDEKTSADLIEHLFTLYEVPTFLYPQWFKEWNFGIYRGLDYDSDDPADLLRNSYDYLWKGQAKWICWFLLLGLGGSIKRAAKLFNWNIPSKFTHYLFSASLKASSPVEACIYAEIRRLGGTEHDWQRIIEYDHELFIIDPTEGSFEDDFHEYFWRSTIQWFIEHSSEIPDHESSNVLDWAIHKYTEDVRNGSQTFSWKGRSPRAVIRNSTQYQQEISMVHSQPTKWKKYGLGWELDSSDKWSFKELTHSHQLAKEGKALHHCVSLYDRRCVSGESAIVSVKRNDTHCLTIEINPQTKRIVQALGVCNRKANAEEESILKLWKDTVLGS